MKIVMLVALAATLAVPARSQETAAPAKQSWSAFFKNLRSSLQNSAVSGQQKKGRNAAAVAAVRGSAQAKKNIADPNEPGLKGDSKAKKAAKELALNGEFDAAVNLIIDGKAEDGLKELERIKAANKSYRVDDINKAIEGAKAMIAEKNGGQAPSVKE